MCVWVWVCVGVGVGVGVGVCVWIPDGYSWGGEGQVRLNLLTGQAVHVLSIASGLNLTLCQYQTCFEINSKNWFIGLLGFNDSATARVISRR